MLYSPAEALTKLAKDESWAVRYYVAGNPNTPAQILLDMAETEASTGVLKALRNNPNYSGNNQAE